MQRFPLSQSRERETVRHEAKRRSVRVAQSLQLTDTIVRITFTGRDLEDFSSVGPDDHIKVFFGSETGSVARDYTPSEFRPDAPLGPELDIDFVLHGDEGPASAWAAAAAIGDGIEIGGPRGSRLSPAGFSDVLLIADPAGMPALRRWARAFEGVASVRAILYGTDGRLVEYLDGSTLASAPLLSPANDLLQVVANERIDGDTFVWAGGEANALIPVRRWLKSNSILEKTNVSLQGYWRSGMADLGHHAPIDPSDPD